MKQAHSITLINQTTGPLFIDIANSMANHGFEVELLTGRIESTYAKLSEKVKVNSFVPYNRMTSFKRIFTWGLFTFIAFFKLLFTTDKSPLLIVSNPPFAPFLGLFFKKIRNRPYSLLIYDIYPDALVNFGILSENASLVKIWNKFNTSLFEQADQIFTISSHMETTIKKYYDQHDNLAVIPNWVDTNFITPMKKEENWFAKKYNQVDKITVLYSGNLGITHDLESLVEAARILKEEEQLRFLIIGDGAKKDKIAGLIEEYKLENIELLPFQDPETIPFSMTTADISVVTLAQGAEGLSVPSKTYYMMASGSAIIAIADESSELAELIDTYEIGAVISPGNADGVARFIKRMISDSIELKKLRGNSHTTAKKFTPKNADIYTQFFLKQSTSV